MTELRFTLNGQAREVEGIPPTTTVLDWLRGHAHLTGTKEGCAEGDCGACTVAVARPGHDSRYQAMNSCLMMLPQIDGCDVLTVEGVSPSAAALHPVQQALVETDGTQCGFCTPGFVMSMFAMEQDDRPSNDDQIHDALAGNLCRCTGYRSIVDACRRVLADTDHDRKPAVRHSADATSYQVTGQTFLAPQTIDDLLAAVEQHPGALILAGGTDLGLRVSKDRERFPVVIATASVAELARLHEGPDGLTLGGAVTYSKALPALDRHFPSFAALVRRIGSRQIRNLGTFAGNLANASPIGDTIPCLIALDATITLRSRGGERRVPANEFITAYRKTVMAKDEIIAAIYIPYVRPDERFEVYKVSKRFDQDISAVLGAFRLKLDGGKVASLHAAYGGMAARGMRASQAEQALTGKPWTQETLASLDDVMAKDFQPLDDQRASAAYRLRAAANLLRRLQIETTSSTLARVEAL